MQKAVSVSEPASVILPKIKRTNFCLAKCNKEVNCLGRSPKLLQNGANSIRWVHLEILVTPDISGNQVPKPAVTTAQAGRHPSLTAQRLHWHIWWAEAAQGFQTFTSNHPNNTNQSIYLRLPSGNLQLQIQSAPSHTKAANPELNIKGDTVPYGSPGKLL